MNTLSNPDKVHKPVGKYHHAVKIPENSEWLVISGQVGIDPAGKVAGGISEQTEQAFRNVVACLEANGMAKEDLVKLTVYLTDPRFIGDYRAVRSAVIGDDIQPASTLVIVSGLATPGFLVEIEAWAAKPRG